MSKEVVKVRIYAGLHERFETPVYFLLPKSNLLTKNLSKAYLETERERFPIQLKENKEFFEAFLIVPHMNVQETLEGKIVLVDAEEDKEEFSYSSSDGTIKISYNEQLIMGYNYGNWLKKPYFYPVVSPNGVRVTEDGPKDHVHHRSLWVAHGDINGFDFWSEFENSGKIEANEVKVISSGKIVFELSSKNLWIENTRNVELYEDRFLRIWKPTKDLLLDFSISIFNNKKDTKFGDTKEGGILSVRVNEKIKVQNGGKIENSFGGINEEETWGKRAAWCNYSGKVDGRNVGIAIFDHIENFRFPTYWHVRDYGLMTANMFGVSYFNGSSKMKGDYILPKGEVLKFKYRVLVHEGKDPNYIKSKYIDFIYPPKVEVLY
ncbi:MAG: PmoA family protein [Thermoproteota archaeon]|nr:PmoA family protein [Candidatus Brockarchaeota archaeon]